MSPTLIPDFAEGLRPGNRWSGPPDAWLEDEGPTPRPTDPVILLIYPIGPVAKSMALLGSSLCREYKLSGEPTEFNRVHVTLGKACCFGRLSPGTLADIDRVASNLSMPPFLAGLDHVKNFGREKGALVLCGGEGVVGIRMLRDELATGMRMIGLARWPRRYEPHATLNYKHCSLPRRDIEEIRWTVSELTLICSLEGRHLHRVIGRWQLRASHSPN